MNPDIRCIKMADSILWEVFEKKYSGLFKVKSGSVTKPLRTTLGALVLQIPFQYSDQKLVEKITGNPYLQYFIRLAVYQEKPPFDSGTLVLFQKHINARMIAEANESMLSFQKKKGGRCPNYRTMENSH